MLGGRYRSGQPIGRPRRYPLPPPSPLRRGFTHRVDAGGAGRYPILGRAASDVHGRNAQRLPAHPEGASDDVHLNRSFAQPGAVSGRRKSHRAHARPHERRRLAGSAALDPDRLAARAQNVLTVIAGPGQESAVLAGCCTPPAGQVPRLAPLSLTRGEASPLNSTCRPLEAVRPWELQLAASVLGVASVAVATYPDGGLRQPSEQVYLHASTWAASSPGERAHHAACSSTRSGWSGPASPCTSACAPPTTWPPTGSWPGS